VQVSLVLPVILAVAVRTQHFALGNLCEDLLLAVFLVNHVRDAEFFLFIAVMEIQA